MKKIFILLSALFFGNLQLTAQWSTNGASIVWTPDNVGIGTSIPNSKLHVNSASGQNGLRVQINGSTKLVVSSNGGVSVGSLSTAPTNGLYVSGSAGIGTTVPFRKLQIQEGDIRIQRSASAARYFEFVSTVANQNDVRLEHDFSGGSLYFSSSNNNFGSFTDLARFSLLSAPTYVFTIFGSGLASGGLWVNSDLKLKKNIVDYNSAIDIIKQLKPKTYSFKNDEYRNLNLPSSKQYGFVAQEVEEILPELVQTSQQPVRTNASGGREMEDVKSVNYFAFIPILTKAMQEQQQTITTLEERIGKLEAALTKITSKNKEHAIGNELTGAKLEQNTPNPFSQITTIRYKIPAGTTGQVTLYDQSGKLVKTLNATASGSSQIKAYELQAGTYTYSLSVNGKLIESKKMMIMK